jgi:hypothetical protein
LAFFSLTGNDRDLLSAINSILESAPRPSPDDPVQMADERQRTRQIKSRLTDLLSLSQKKDSNAEALADRFRDLASRFLNSVLNGHPS